MIGSSLLSKNPSSKNLKIVRKVSPEIKNLLELGKKIFNIQNNKENKPIDSKFFKYDKNQVFYKLFI